MGKRPQRGCHNGAEGGGARAVALSPLGVAGLSVLCYTRCIESLLDVRGGV